MNKKIIAHFERYAVIFLVVDYNSIYRKTRYYKGILHIQVQERFLHRKIVNKVFVYLDILK
ncbi:UNVERIFIED_ORG: hypothetical protein ABIC97_003615 [Peribacillus simplex]